MAQQAIPWQQHDFAQTFALCRHLPGEATAGPPAMLRSIARITNSFVTGNRVMVSTSGSILSANMGKSNTGSFNRRGCVTQRKEKWI
jgi:hypothetical protein